MRGGGGGEGVENVCSVVTLESVRLLEAVEAECIMRILDTGG